VTTFSDFGLSAPLLQALNAEGYTKPTPIQTKAIPVVLDGSDLLGIAQTGTGKTAAFALPILERLAARPGQPPRRGCRVLVLSPTRELASQIADSFRTYGRHTRLSVAVVFGGVAHRPQIQALARGVDVLVATPGRLLDHVAERAIVLQETEILVLDEADQMLDLGFQKPIRRIVSYLPARRQNLFFSATMPGEIASLANDLLKDPVRISVTPVSSTVERIAQQVVHVEASRKRAVLTELLAHEDMARTLVFTRTKHGADRLTRQLEAAGIHAAAIHGNKSQRQREAALLAFRNAKIRVLVATDIAARGIDIDGVTHVVNFELPEVPEAYVHRIGRTARAGASGKAISLCDPSERHLLRAVEKLTRQQIRAENRCADVSLEADAKEARSDTRGRANRNARPAAGRRGQGQPAANRQHREARGGEGGHDRRRHTASKPGEGAPAQSGAARREAIQERPRSPAAAATSNRDWESGQSENSRLRGRNKRRGGPKNGDGHGGSGRSARTALV